MKYNTNPFGLVVIRRGLLFHLYDPSTSEKGVRFNFSEPMPRCCLPFPYVTWSFGCASEEKSQIPSSKPGLLWKAFLTDSSHRQGLCLKAREDSPMKFHKACRFLSASRDKAHSSPAPSSKQCVLSHSVYLPVSVVYHHDLFLFLLNALQSPKSPL